MKSRFSAPEARNQLNKLTRHVAGTVTVGPRGRLDAGKPRRRAGVARERSTDLPSGPVPGVGRAASSLMPLSRAGCRQTSRAHKFAPVRIMVLSRTREGVVVAKTATLQSAEDLEDQSIRRTTRGLVQLGGSG